MLVKLHTKVYPNVWFRVASPKSQILKIPLITNLMLNMSLMKKELRFHEFPSPPMTQIMLVVFSVGTLLLFSYNGT